MDKYGTYRLSISSEHSFYPADFMFSDLARYTNNIPLKILANCCEGEFLQHYLSYLSKGTVLMTIADKNKGSDSFDKYNQYSEKLLSLLSNNGHLNIEDLLILICLEQKRENNEIIIGIHISEPDGCSSRTVEIKIGDYISSLTNNTDLTSVIDSRVIDLLKFKGIKLQDVKSILSTLSIKGKDYFRLPSDEEIAATLVEYIKNNNLNNFLQWVGSFLYYPTINTKFVIYDEILELLETNTPKSIIPSMYLAEIGYLTSYLAIQHEKLKNLDTKQDNFTFRHSKILQDITLLEGHICVAKEKSIRFFEEELGYLNKELTKEHDMLSKKLPEVFNRLKLLRSQLEEQGRLKSIYTDEKTGISQTLEELVKDFVRDANCIVKDKLTLVSLFETQISKVMDILLDLENNICPSYSLDGGNLFYYIHCIKEFGLSYKNDIDDPDRAIPIINILRTLVVDTAVKEIHAYAENELRLAEARREFVVLPEEESSLIGDNDGLVSTPLCCVII